MTGNFWQQRVARAEELAIQHSFSSELLLFYARLVRFQEGIYVRIGATTVGEFSAPLDSNQLPKVADPFLLMVVDHGPPLLADVAHRLRSPEFQDEWLDLLNTTWAAPELIPSEPQDFLARAFLQPYAERTRIGMPAPQNSSARRVCPFCHRKPGAGILRPQGDGALRSLLCSLCQGEWEFRRIACANCGEESNLKLPVYTAHEFPHIRVECCDSCKTYIKAIDLTKSGRADPVADEIASAPLDLWAREHSYAKLHPNLLGL